jgi:hypothetical protein
MAIALAEQVKELHQAAQDLDDNLKATHDWAATLFENPARDEGGAPATDREEELLATVADQGEEIARLKADAVLLNEAIADFVVQSRQNSTAPPGGGNGDDNDRTRRENSVLSQTSVAGGKRSSKAPDPPIFHNEKDRDTEDFEQWYRDIENKLTVNADHFDNDKARQAYIESRMGGRAKRELAPYLRDTHPEPIKTSDRLLTHLWDQYYNPLLAQKALDDYDDLKMGPGADYLAFKNDFVRLAGECGKTRAEWKREFNRRLTPNLQRHLAGAFLDPTVDFDQFTRLGLQQAMINKRANEQQKAERAKSGDAGGNREKSKAPPKANNNGGAPRAAADPDKKLSQDEVRILFQEGRCFVCREKGHTSRNCPKKQAGDPDREARLKALQEKWAPATPTGTSAGSANTGPVESNRIRFEAPSDSEN